jgi:hypothetical protein
VRGDMNADMRLEEATRHNVKETCRCLRLTLMSAMCGNETKDFLNAAARALRVTRGSRAKILETFRTSMVTGLQEHFASLAFRFPAWLVYSGSAMRLK